MKADAIGGVIDALIMVGSGIFFTPIGFGSVGRKLSEAPGASRELQSKPLVGWDHF